MSENVIEASWEALVDSLEYAFQPVRAPRVSAAERGADPARQAGPRGAGGGAGARGDPLRDALARSDAAALRGGPRGPDRRGAELAVGVSSGTTALHLAVREQGWGPGDEVLTTPAQLHRLLQLPALRGRDAGLLRRRPGDAHRRSGRDGGAVGPATAGLLPVHIFGFPADMPRDRGHRGRARPRGGRGRRPGARHGLRRRRQRRRARQSRRIRLLRQQADDDGGGGMLISGSEAAAEVARSERNQGRAPGMKFMEHDRLGFNYRLTDVQAALGDRPARAPRLDDGGALGGSPRPTRSASPRSAAPSRARATPTTSSCRSRDRGAERRSWFVYVLRLPKSRRPRRRHRRARPPRHRRPSVPAVHPHSRASSGSGSAPARASSRSPRTSRGARSRCRSTRRSGGVARAGRRAS